MTTEIKTENIIHPTAGTLVKKFIYTYSDEGKIINKEFYVEPPKVPALEILKSLSREELEQIKQLLK